MPHSKVQQFKYFKILIQEFHVKVDMGFINALLEIFQSGELSDAEEVSSLCTELLPFVTWSLYLLQRCDIFGTARDLGSRNIRY